VRERPVRQQALLRVLSNGVEAVRLGDAGVAPQVCSSKRHRSRSMRLIWRLSADASGPQQGEAAAEMARLVAQLAATSRDPDASPFAHQSVHSPSYTGTRDPISFSMLVTASVAVVSRNAG
jgi:hypothetical protein